MVFVNDPIAMLRQALSGRYDLQRELGAGGMATVYLARDVKHDRDVAIKVLHEDLGAALGAERFLSEIRTTARLQHPHILPLLDSGEADGLLYYVMPLVTGETLRARLVREKQLPMDDVLRFAREAGDALQYAHEQGVIHRDIKPENILLQNGHAVVADFGIALAVQSAGGSRMTQTGLSLGTPQYMSPEQAMGEKAIDARSDVYALGAVTYEMITGDPPFTGSTVQAIVAKVLTERPTAPSAVRDTVSAGVERAVLKALAKLPADRFASARAFVEAIERPTESGATTESGARAAGAQTAGARLAAGHSRTERFVAGGCAMLAVIALVGWWRAARGASVREELVRLTINLPPGVKSKEGPGQIAVSSDGRLVAVVAEGSGHAPVLYVRSLADVTPVPIAGTEGAQSSSFSPDGRWVAFTTMQSVKKVQVTGGPVTVLADINGEETGISWGSAGLIFVGVRGRIGVVPENGGEYRQLQGSTTKSGDSERYPIALSDGRSLLYTTWGGSVATSRIMRRTVENTPATAVGLDTNVALGLTGGWLLAGGAGGVLRLAPISSDATHLTGPARQVFDGVAATIQVPQATVAANGTLAYLPGSGLADLVSVGLRGDTTVLSTEQHDYVDVRLSPDATKLATAAAGRGGNDIFVVDLAAKSTTRISSDGRTNGRPEWTPDGARLLYRSFRTGASELWWQPSSGGGNAERLLSARSGDVWEGVISPDAQWLAYRTGTLNTADIWYRRLSGDTTAHPFASSSGADVEPRFSPDGRWLAYSSSESGAYHVYVRAFPDGGQRLQVSSDGGGQPVWSRDGKAIFYVGALGGVIVRARLSGGAPLRVIARDTVVRGRYYLAARNGHPLLDVMPDGEHLVLIRRVDAEVQPVVAFGWLAEARARYANAASAP